MRAEILSIGDELLIGQVVNTNASYLGKVLSEIGIAVGRVSTVGDDRAEIRRAFKRAWKEFDVVIVTGGLGPTHDDISKDEVARFFGKKLYLDQTALRSVKARFKRFGYTKMPESNIGQAMVPEGFTAITNKVGTAPGLFYQEKEKTFVILPGVPHEMRWLMENGILKRLEQSYRTQERSIIKHRTLLTIGIGESLLAEKIGDVKEFLSENSTLAFLPKNGMVRLRISVHGAKASTVNKEIATIEKRLRERAEKWIYGADEETLEGNIIALLAKNNYTISTAESCTGGMIAARLTDVAGSSSAFLGSIVCYDNKVKKEELGVPQRILTKHGAVSEEVATILAENVRTKLGTTFGIGVTGVAGPGGGTPEKPVGTVWIALAEKGKPTFVKRYSFVGDRAMNRERSTNTALDLLRRRLVGLPLG